MGPWSHEEDVETFRGDVDLSAAVTVIRDHELAFYDRYLRDEGNDWEERPPLELFVLGRNEWRGESEWPLAGHRAHAVLSCARGGRARPRRAALRRARRPLHVRPRGPRADDRRRQLGADDDAGRGAADPARPVGPARARGARRRALLHERRARRRPRGDRAGRDGALRGVEREGHRLLRPRLRRLSGRPLDLPHRGDHPRALPQLERGRQHRAARAGRGRRVPDPLLPARERASGGATASAST